MKFEKKIIIIILLLLLLLYGVSNMISSNIIWKNRCKKVIEQ